jgi:NAD(P)-dependent dehydrogenase (short-subunit alcohol dehydrogenase family)
MMNRYATAFAKPQGPGDARPTALQIIHENNMKGKWTDKVVIVITGVSSGLGVEMIRALKTTGARIIGTARDVSKARQALSDVHVHVDDSDANAAATTIDLVEMDQSSLLSVRSGAKEILAKTGGSVNILIANAGVMAIPTLQKSSDGFELHFATNHLSHFLLFNLLKPALLKASTPDFQSRVVMVGAGWHRASGIAPANDYNFEQSKYDPWIAYARSKTANTYMANEIERRHGASHHGIHATSLHPGIILSTRVTRHVAGDLADGARTMFRDLNMSAAQGAATPVYAALSGEWEGRGGVYLVNCAEADKGEDDRNPASDTYVSHTYNPTEEDRLWKDSMRMVQLEE